MAGFRQVYFQWYWFVFGLYVFLNKGVAYTYLVEFTWLMGLVTIILSRKQYAFVWNRIIALLLFFLLLSTAYIIRAWAEDYSLIDSVRDSFVFQYGWFVFIVFLFRDSTISVWQPLAAIYQWFPAVALLNFLLQSYFPQNADWHFFGDIPILLYKNGDMGVHLLVSALLLVSGKFSLSAKWYWVLAFLIVFDFLILSAYSRSGMLAFLLGFGSYFFFNRNRQQWQLVQPYLKYIPLLLLLVIPIYASLQVEENFQGRKAGLTQLKENIVSVFISDGEGGLEDNKVWRLVWWTQILEYSFQWPNIAIGKGLGMSLAIVDDIVSEDELVRSPHNFHLTIMARFGVLVFLLWCYFLWLLLQPLFKRLLGGDALLLACFLVAFLFNGSLDVFLEGPMGAFPFWTFVGLYILQFSTPVSPSDHAA